MDLNSLASGYQPNAQLLNALISPATMAGPSASAASSSKSKVNAADKEKLEKLLFGLSQVLSETNSASQLAQASTSEGGQPAGEGAPLISPELAQALLKLLAGNQDDNRKLTPTETQELIKQYQGVQEVLGRIKDLLAEQVRGEGGDERSEKLTQLLLQSQELMAQFEDILEAKLKRQSGISWYTLWRLIYRDELPTKAFIRARQREMPLTWRSLPEGVDPAQAHAALTEVKARPDLEHASQILQVLKDRHV